MKRCTRKEMVRKFIIWFCGFCSVLVSCLFYAGIVWAGGLSSDDLARINDAVTEIQDYALIPPKSSRLTSNDILRAYIRFFDDYGDFLTRKEFEAFLQSSTSDYFGVEMDMAKKNDRIYLYPFKGGLAERHGIRPGDELMAVDGEPVYGKSFFQIGSIIRGSNGKPVHLTVRTGQGIPRVFSIRRQQTSYVSVRHKSFNQAEYIQITRFVKDSADLLRRILKSIAGKNRTVVIDLRQNQGGLLRVAGKAADLFLSPGVPMYHLRTRKTVRDVISETQPLLSNPVIIIQDRVTASAAEVFAAALTENGRAVSAGEKSFGKGVAQRFFPLSDGSALRLTFAEILTPKNTRYNRKGLIPDVQLPPGMLSPDIKPEDFVGYVIQAVSTSH